MVNNRGSMLVYVCIIYCNIYVISELVIKYGSFYFFGKWFYNGMLIRIRQGSFVLLVGVILLVDFGIRWARDTFLRYKYKIVSIYFCVKQHYGNLERRYRVRVFSMSRQTFLKFCYCFPFLIFHFGSNLPVSAWLGLVAMLLYWFNRRLGTIQKLLKISNSLAKLECPERLF